MFSLPEDSELYLADESGVDEYYDREYGYAPRGEKVVGVVAGRKFERTNIVAAERLTVEEEKIVVQVAMGEIDDKTKTGVRQSERVVAPMAYKGTTDSALFEGWVEFVFVPDLLGKWGNDLSKCVLIIDNASFHNKTRLQDIADEYGFRLLFLPPYSPDFNPIEKFWANLKRRLRLHMRNFKDFWEALSHAFQ